MIFASGPAGILAARSATSTIPIIILGGGDLVGTGVVAGLGRPGGNLTGISIMATELEPKRFDLLSELAPQASVIGLLVNPNSPAAECTIGDVQEAASAKGVQLHVLTARAETISRAPSPPSSNCMPARLSSPLIRFSTAGAKNSCHWRHAPLFRRSTSGASSPTSAA